jgi:transcriptional regulator with XRE-family HTH domain
VAHSISEMLAELPPKRRARIEARANELIEEELSLRELRKAMGRTQAKLAADLGVGQDTVSRYESRSDMLLSTLSEYVQKIGGELELTVKFSDRRPVRLKGFTDIVASASRKQTKTKMTVARRVAARKRQKRAAARA